MRIVHVVNELDNGGVTSVALDLAAAQLEHGHDVQICQLADGSWSDRASSVGVPVVTGLRAIARLVKNDRPDIMHCHQRRAAMVSIVLGQRRRTVEHVHNIFSGASLLSFRGAVIVAVSRNVKEHLCRTYAHLDEQVTTVRNLASVPVAAADSARTRTLIAVGRLDEQKNPEYFLRIVGALRCTDSSIRALWIGDGKLRDNFLTLREELGLSGTVRWVREMSRLDVLTELSRTSITVISSDWEGFPIVAIESWSQGTPVATTDVGELAAYIRENNAGIVIPMRDAVAAASSLRAALELSSTRSSFELFELFRRDFAVESALASWEAVYERVV